jgi:hypothetical protein
MDPDAGSSCKKIQNASFDLTSQMVECWKASNLFGVLESTLWGTAPEYSIETIRPDLTAIAR